MKFSALLSLLILGGALVLILSRDKNPNSNNGAGSDRTAEFPGSSAPTAPKTAPRSMDAPSSLPSEFAAEPDRIRFIGHDWVEVIKDDDGARRTSPFALPKAGNFSLLHPAHSAGSKCRVCELVRVMNQAW